VHKTHRLAAAGALAALTLTLAACGSGDAASTAAPGSSAASSSSAAASSSAMPAADGVTTTDDIFGPACDQVPTSGEGSAQGMVDDPVATAASNNPLLSTLVTAVGAVPGLADTLNSSPELTVFAPFNGAFEKIPADTLNGLLAAPDQLQPILAGHVSQTRYDAEGLVEAGTVNVLSGGTVTVAGTAEAPTFDGGNGTAATTLCGNIPTSNATVFVIDSVLMPAS
jgi:uncharacterized surface protein with fasciclin (FAS1) repeats